MRANSISPRSSAAPISIIIVSRQIRTIALILIARICCSGEAAVDQFESVQAFDFIVVGLLGPEPGTRPLRAARFYLRAPTYLTPSLGNGALLVAIYIARCLRTEAGWLRWTIRRRNHLVSGWIVVLRMDQAHTKVLAYWLLPAAIVLFGIVEFPVQNAKLDFHGIGTFDSFQPRSRQGFARSLRAL
jgi:hypothetical protein